MLNRFALLLPILAGVVAAQPVINPGGVRNGASLASPGLPNSGIAQGSIFVVFGRNLAACGAAASTSIVESGVPRPARLGTEPATTSIRITSGASPVDAPMVYTAACLPDNRPDQLAAILPSTVPVGTASLTVTYNGNTSAPQQFTVVKSGFGITAQNQNGSGPGIITEDLLVDNQYPRITLVNAANPGQVAVMWGTGLGPINQDDAQGAQGGNMTDLNVELLVGGKVAQIQYQGRTPTATGLDQINFVVPAGVSGCYVPVQVRVGGVPSNFVTMAIANTGKSCSDEAGFLTPADLENAQANGLKVGSITLSRFSLNLSVLGQNIRTDSDSGFGTFSRFDYATLIQSQLEGGITPYGTCYVFNFSGDTPEFVDPVNAPAIDAGPALTVTRLSDSASRQIPRLATGEYSADLGGSGIPGFPGAGEPLFFDPGQFRLTGPGGADVDSFQADFTIPPQVVWAEQNTITRVPRSSDLTLNWSGGSSDGVVSIFGGSTVTGGAAGENQTIGAGFYCTERASVGTFTIPSAVLSSLPASTQAGDLPTGLLAVGSSPAVTRFTAEGLNAGTIVFSQLNTVGVAYE